VERLQERNKKIVEERGRIETDLLALQAEADDQKKNLMDMESRDEEFQGNFSNFHQLLSFSFISFSPSHSVSFSQFKSKLNRKKYLRSKLVSQN
jgi:hypothetical protein